MIIRTRILIPFLLLVLPWGQDQEQQHNHNHLTRSIARTLSSINLVQASSTTSRPLIPLFGNRKNSWFGRQKNNNQVESKNRNSDDSSSSMNKSKDDGDETIVDEPINSKEGESSSSSIQKDESDETNESNIENESNSIKDDNIQITNINSNNSTATTISTSTESNPQLTNTTNTSESETIPNNTTSLQQTSPPPSSSSIIFLSPQSFTRPTSPHTLFPPTTTSSKPISLPPNNTNHKPLSSMEATILSIIASLLPILTRLFVLTLLSKSSLFNPFHESDVYSPSPTQHFMLERINDRYRKDTLALHKALHHPPQSSIGGGGGLLSSLFYRPTFDNEGNNNSSSSKWSGILQKRRNKAKIDLLQNELEQQDRQEQILKHSNDNNDNNNIKSTSKQPPILSNQKRIKLLQQQELQNQNTLSSIYRRTVILLDVKTTDLNDITSTVEYLRDAISFLLRIYYDSKSNVKLDLGTQLEIVFCVESPGGVVQDFGLAADQIKRLKMARSVRRSTTSNTKHTNTVEKGVEEEDRNDLVVTICVDKIAASGGYMIASQADQGQLLCAPFAVIGSIGVLRETINVYDVLDKYGVKPLLLKAGTAKAPLSSTTKITEESVALVQRNLDKVHDAFQRMVLESRGSVIDASNVAEVMNGDIFLGQDAHGLGLVDRVMTSDEYIDERICAGDRVLRLHKYDKLRHGIKFSPLDLLLMNQNGLLSKIGRKVPIQVLVNMISKSVPFLKFLGAIGFMKVMDSRYKFPFASIEAYNSKSWQ